MAARDRGNSRGEIATTSCPTFVPSCPMTWHKRALEQTREPGVRNEGQRRMLQDCRGRHWDLTMKLLAPVADVEPTHQIQSQAGQELVRWERRERRWEEEEWALTTKKAVTWMSRGEEWGQKGAEGELERVKVVGKSEMELAGEKGRSWVGHRGVKECRDGSPAPSLLPAN